MTPKMIEVAKSKNLEGGKVNMFWDKISPLYDDYFVPRAPVLSVAQHHCFLIANHQFAVQPHFVDYLRLLQYLRMFVFPVSTQVVV